MYTFMYNKICFGGWVSIDNSPPLIREACSYIIYNMLLRLISQFV